MTVMVLSHPLGDQKPVLLQRLYELLPQHPDLLDSRSIRALFPELYLAKGHLFYHQHVIAPFAPHFLASGDQSEKLQSEFEQVIALHVPENATRIISTATVLEVTSSPERSAAFLAGHYYRHAMNVWFWQFFEQAKSSSLESWLYAADLAYFEGKPMEHVRSYYEVCLSSATPEKQQRLWNKLAVCYALRAECEEAQKAISESFLLLNTVEEAVERDCRHADCINAQALILYKSGDLKSALHTLESAFALLEPYLEREARARRIQNVLNGNRQRLLKSKEVADWQHA